MRSFARDHASIAALCGFVLQIIAPALAAILILAVLFVWVSDFMLLRPARARDMARVDCYAKFSKMVLESSMGTKPVQEIIREINALGLDVVEYLPPDPPPGVPHVRFIPQQSLVQAWQFVNGPDGKPVGIVRIGRVDDSFRLMTGATRRFTAALALSGLVLCAIFLWTTRVLFVSKIKRLTEKIRALAPEAQHDALPFSTDPVGNLASAVGKYSDSMRGEREANRIFLDGHTEAACLSTAEGKLLEVNAAFCSIFGRTREQLIGRNRLDLVPAADRTEVVHALQRLSPKNPVNVIEFRIVLPDGSLRWMRWHDTARFEESGDKRILSFGKDITAEKELEARVEGLQRAFDQMQSLARTGSLTWDLASDRMQWTTEAARLLGTDGSEATAPLETLLAAVCPEHREAVGDLFRRASDTGEPFEFEFCIGPPGKDRRYLQSRAEVRADSKTKLLTHLTCTLRDITTLRKAEEEKSREFQFRKAVEQALGVGIVVLDREGLPQSANQTYLRMIGWTEDELRAMRSPYPFWVEEDIPKIEEALRLSLAEQAPPAGFELRFRHKDGDIFDVLVNTVKLSGGNGEHLGYVSSVTDITSIQQTRRQLAEANEVLSVAAEVAEAGVWVLEPPKSCRIEWSRRSFAIHGDPDGRDPAATYRRAVPPAERERSDAYLRQVMASGESEGRNQMDVVWPDGSVHRISSHFRVIRDEKTGAIVIVGIHRDITGFLRREQELRGAIERQRIAVESAGMGLWEWNPRTDKLTWDRRSFAIFGNPEGTDEEAVWRAAIAPRERDLLTRKMHSLAAGRETSGSDSITVRWSDGQLRSVVSTYGIIRDEEGDAVAVIGVNRDTTPEEQRTQSLRDVEHRLQMAIESARLGTFEHVFGEGSKNWNRINYELHGIDPRITDPAELFEVWKGVVGEATYRRLMDDFLSLPRTQTVYTYEFELQAGDKPPRRARTCAYIERDAEGKPVLLLGISRQIGS